MGKVDYVIEGGIATVTFTNPPKGFFIAEMVVQLGAIMTALENDPAVRVIIFTGGLPDVFIRHFSVEEILGMADAVKARRAQGLPNARFARTPLRLVWEQVDNCQKPTIAAINGFCGGGGCELTLCCDISQVPAITPSDRWKSSSASSPVQVAPLGLPESSALARRSNGSYAAAPSTRKKPPAKASCITMSKVTSLLLQKRWPASSSISPPRHSRTSNRFCATATDARPAKAWMKKATCSPTSLLLMRVASR
jgi:hypothetical protein